MWSVARAIYRTVFTTVLLVILAIGVRAWQLSAQAELPIAAAQSSRSNVIEYDFETAQNNRIFNEALAEASNCVDGTLKTFLATGLRERNRLVGAALSNCGRRIIDIYATVGISQKDALSFLEVIADQHLDAIVKYQR